MAGFGDLFSQAAQQGGQSLVQAGANNAMNVGINEMLSNMLQQSLVQGGQAITPSLFEGFLSQAGNIGGDVLDFLGSKAGENTIGLGFNVLDQVNKRDTAQTTKDFLGRDMAMKEEAFRRDMEADDRRRLLTF